MEKQPSRVLFATINLVLVLASIALGAWTFFNRQDLIDWWRLQQFKPSATLVQLADHATMVGRGRDLFFASEPAIESHEVFNSHCNNTGEKSIVLGCYKAATIYLFDVTDERLSGVEEVTAAHEMLHAVYERMSESEKDRINALLEPQIKGITDERLLGLIELYNKTEAGQLYNEMHSILGTEVRNLSPELEHYYKQYFANRDAIVRYSERYESIFTASKQRIAEMDARIETLKKQITINNAALEQQYAQIGADSDRLNQLRASGDYSAYNQSVPGYNTKVRIFNMLVEQTRLFVAEHNDLVETRNKEAAAQNNLYKSLDSRYQPVQQN